MTNILADQHSSCAANPIRCKRPQALALLRTAGVSFECLLDDSRYGPALWTVLRLAGCRCALAWSHTFDLPRVEGHIRFRSGSWLPRPIVSDADLCRAFYSCNLDRLEDLVSFLGKEGLPGLGYVLTQVVGEVHLLTERIFGAYKVDRTVADSDR